MSERLSRVCVLIGVAALVLAACGGGDSDTGRVGAVTTIGGVDTGGSSSVESGQGSTDDEAGEASATLLIGDQEYVWTSEDVTSCTISGIFPASADFGVPPSQGGDGPWVQFIDRGDGGINFSALIEGREYSGTGSGQADEIRSDGFTYTGEMGSEGERFDVQLEVVCG